MNTDDWLQSIPNRPGSTPEDIEAAKVILAYEGRTIPAELAEGNAVRHLTELDVLEVRPKAGSDGIYEYRPIVQIPGARWPLKADEGSS